MRMDVTVVDYGMGNLLSVRRALEHVGGRVTLADRPEELEGASHLVLPGVGAFGDGMGELRARGLVEGLLARAAEGIPLLGICLGAQMLFERSEEFGLHRGLGLIEGEVKALPGKDVQDNPLKIPHVGWSDLQVEQTAPVLDGVSTGSAVYFVHSFECHPSDRQALLAYCRRGGRPVSAVLGKGNVIGCQFHPEKSGPVGLRILYNFLRWDGRK